MAGVSRPVELLDKRTPNWRERFPIAVEDDSAESLLVGLVREAAREVKAVISYPVLGTRSLHPCDDGETYELALALEMPTTMPLSALAAACGVTAEAIPQAFALELQNEQRLRLGDGRQLLGGDAAVMLAGSSRRLLGSEAVSEQTLVLRGTGIDLHSPVSIPGAEALDPEEPWVFTCKDVGTIFAGAGSVRLADDRCLVAVKADVKIVSASASSELVQKGYLTGLIERRCVYELKGTCEVAGDEVSFLVQTGQVAGHSEQLVWRGRRAPYGGGPLPVYRGLPEVCRLTPDGDLLPVGAAEIEWVHARACGDRIRNPRQHRGPIDAWLVKDTQRQRRFRMILVDHDARIHFKSGDSPTEGAIEFHNWGLKSLSGPQSLSKSASVCDTVARIDLSAPGRPPASMRIMVAWPQSAISQRLDLPFPSTGGRFTGPDGKEFLPGASVSLRQLHDLRAQVFDRNPDAPSKYVLSIELQSSTGGRRPLRSEHSVVVDAQGVGEIRLFELESTLLGLICQSDELDARLELRLNVRQTIIAKLYLTRYDADLERCGLAMAISGACMTGLKTEEVARAHLMAISMFRADAQERKLHQATSSDMPVGRWDLITLKANEGPWLVYPAADSALQVRPTLYAGISIGPTTRSMANVCALGLAMDESDVQARTQAIRHLTSAMAADFGHPSWRLIARHQQLLSHLPLSTFDYWRAIAKDMAACLTVVLKLPGDMPSLMRRVRDELSVMWELMPRPVLHRAFEQTLQTWARELKIQTIDPLCRSLVEAQFRRLGEASLLFGDLIDVMLYQAGFAWTERLNGMIGAVRAGPKRLLSDLWHGEHSLLQRFLLRTHAEERFWPYFDLSRGLVESFQTLAPERASLQLEPFARDLLWMPTSGTAGANAKNVKADVANAPLLAGLLSQCVPSCDWWTQGNRAAELRQIRNFDPVWFETAFRCGVQIGMWLEQTSPAITLETTRDSRHKPNRVASQLVEPVQSGV